MLDMSVSELYRHPVKSLLGERCDMLTLNERGVLGDRLYALLDAKQYIGSHKNSSRFRKLNNLFDLQAGMDGALPTIKFPDGETLVFGDANVDTRLSEHTGEDITINKEDEVSFMDDAPIHLISTAGLNWLTSLLPSAGIDPRRFRPNIVIDCSGDKPVEHDWVGKRISVGACELEIVSLTERCVMTTVPQHGLPKAPEVLKALADKTGVNFGVYAKVTKPGTLYIGDTIKII